MSERVMMATEESLNNYTIAEDSREEDISFATRSNLFNNGSSPIP